MAPTQADPPVNPCGLMHAHAHMLTFARPTRTCMHTTVEPGSPRGGLPSTEGPRPAHRPHRHYVGRCSCPVIPQGTLVSWAGGGSGPGFPDPALASPLLFPMGCGVGRGAGAWASVSHWDWRVCLHVPGTMCEPVAQGTVRVHVPVGRRRWAWLARHVLTVLPASTGVSGLRVQVGPRQAGEGDAGSPWGGRRPHPWPAPHPGRGG